MSPRRSVADALDTRRFILDHAVEVASRDGLEGMTIGRLAGDLRMSKAGVIGHFGTKEALQLAALDQAVEVFTQRVWARAEHAEPGRARLLAIAEAWTTFLARDCFSGGCFLTGASAEFDARPGPVRDAVARELRRWNRVLEAEVRTAIERGELPDSTDPAELVFAYTAFPVAANQAIQLHDDPVGAERALRAMRGLLGA